MSERQWDKKIKKKKKTSEVWVGLKFHYSFPTHKNKNNLDFFLHLENPGEETVTEL